MRSVHRWARCPVPALTLVAVLLAAPADARDAEILAAVPVPDPGDEFAGGGIETCVDCHDETERYPVLSILKTKHAVQADLRTPLGSEHACETCHGASLAHEEDSDLPPGIVFGSGAPSGPQNAVCLGCHENAERIGWSASRHRSEGLACVSCHTIHTTEDPVFGRNLRPERWTGTGSDSQAEVCFGCHLQRRAESHRVSTHPIRDGQAACSGCHDPHGGWGPGMLSRPTVNETCYACHAEKRGPFLWEHAPAREDCSTCHDPHGTNHRPMLVTRGPWLCQQCHQAGFHPSANYGGDLLPPNLAGSGSNKLLGSNCMNCHPEVHGSNHPSGVRWTR